MCQKPAKGGREEGREGGARDAPSQPRHQWKQRTEKNNIGDRKGKSRGEGIGFMSGIKKIMDSCLFHSTKNSLEEKKPRLKEPNQPPFPPESPTSSNSSVSPHQPTCHGRAGPCGHEPHPCIASQRCRDRQARPDPRARRRCGGPRRGLRRGRRWRSRGRRAGGTRPRRCASASRR